MARNRIPTPVEESRGVSRVYIPDKFTCRRCGEESNSIGQEDGVCLRCRWEAKRKARPGGPL